MVDPKNVGSDQAACPQARPMLFASAKPRMWANSHGSSLRIKGCSFSGGLAE